MLNIVAQSILQFNRNGCQDDNLGGQIDVKRLCRTCLHPAQPKLKGLIDLTLTAPTPAGRGCFLWLNVLLVLQEIERFPGRSFFRVRIRSFINKAL